MYCYLHILLRKTLSDRHSIWLPVRVAFAGTADRPDCAYGSDDLLARIHILGISPVGVCAKEPKR